MSERAWWGTLLIGSLLLLGLSMALGTPLRAGLLVVDLHALFQTLFRHYVLLEELYE